MGDIERINRDFSRMTIVSTDPLCLKTVDIISEMVGNDWKAFGNYLGLSVYEVQTIDVDFQTVYEKSYQVIRKLQRSAEEVSLGKVVQVLQQMRRNDILAAIGASAMISPPATMTPAENGDGQLFANLPAHHLHHLESMLCSDYEKVAAKLGFMRDDIEHLRRCSAGGGNPAMNFLEDLERRCPEVKYAKFEEYARSFKRIDIALLIKESECGHVLLGDNAHYKVKEDLAAKLSGSRSTISADWKRFAYEFGYSRHDVDNIEASIRQNAKYRPVEEMFRILVQRRPLFSVVELRKVFEDIGRRDLALYLDKCLP